MAVSGESIVQTVTGSSGATDVTTFTITPGSTVQGGSAVLFFIAQDLLQSAFKFNAYLCSPTSDAANQIGSVADSSATDQPHVQAFSTLQWTDRAGAWTFAQDPTQYVAATPTAWLMVEIFGGLQPADGVVIGSYPAAAQQVTDGSTYDIAKTRDPSGTAVSLDTGYNYGAQTAWSARRQIMFAAFATRALSGATPPALTGFANTTAQPEDWTQLGTSVATSKGSGRNIRLDVAYKVKYESCEFTDCTATWASAPDGGIAAARFGYFSDFTPPGRTLNRQTPTSSVF